MRNDTIKRIIELIEEKNAAPPPSNNDFLDDVLDGKPYYRVDTPGFRRALEKRRLERARGDE